MGGFCGRVCPVFVEANVALVNVEKLRGDGGVRSAHVVHVDVVVDVCVAYLYNLGPKALGAGPRLV